jgi:hypothetical protein
MTEPTEDLSGTVTLQWVNEWTGELVELVVPRRALAAGEVFGRYGGPEPRRFSGQAALDRLDDQMAGIRARLDQLHTSRDDFVTAFPWLKSGRTDPAESA